MQCRMFSYSKTQSVNVSRCGYQLFVLGRNRSRCANAGQTSFQIEWHMWLLRAQRCLSSPWYWHCVLFLSHYSHTFTEIALVSDHANVDVRDFRRKIRALLTEAQTTTMPGLSGCEYFSALKLCLWIVRSGCYKLLLFMILVSGRSFKPCHPEMSIFEFH